MTTLERLRKRDVDRPGYDQYAWNRLWTHIDSRENSFEQLERIIRKAIDCADIAFLVKTRRRKYLERLVARAPIVLARLNMRLQSSSDPVVVKRILRTMKRIQRIQAVAYDELTFGKRAVMGAK